MPINAPTRKNYRIVPFSGVLDLDLTHAFALLQSTGAGPNVVNVTTNDLLPQSWAVGTQISFLQFGAGGVFITPVSTPGESSTITPPANVTTTESAAQFGIMTIINIGPNDWILAGNILP